MDTYMSNLGLDTTQYSFQDVLATEDWALEMVPTPVLGVLMVYPIKPSSEAHREEERARIEREGQEVSSNVYYMKQTVGNACGTVGLLHCIGNVRNQLPIAPGSYLERFYQRTTESTPDEIAQVSPHHPTHRPLGLTLFDSVPQ
jgi:ubiquitin carboxyl-terminal hydrolase L3